MSGERPTTVQFRAWASRLGEIVREMEDTSMQDAEPVLCAARAARYIAVITAESAAAPSVPEEEQ